MARLIFPNLPVKDVARARKFWTSLGFDINEMFSSDDAVCVVVNELASVMLLRTDFFHSFHDTIEGTGTHVLMAISVEDRSDVDRLCREAEAAGASQVVAPVEQGPMYTGSFRDLDDHLWEVLHMDLGAA